MKKALLVLLAAGIVLSLFGCTSEKYGAAVDTRMAAIKVKDIFLDGNLVGRKVTVAGKISSQCGSNGCWFVMQDDTGQVFVNLGPKNMTLPPRMNKIAKVTGTVYPVKGELQIIAEGVEVR